MFSKPMTNDFAICAPAGPTRPWTSPLLITGSRDRKEKNRRSKKSESPPPRRASEPEKPRKDSGPESLLWGFEVDLFSPEPSEELLGRLARRGQKEAKRRTFWRRRRVTLTQRRRRAAAVAASTHNEEEEDAAAAKTSRGARRSSFGVGGSLRRPAFRSLAGIFFTAVFSRQRRNARSVCLDYSQPASWDG